MAMTDPLGDMLTRIRNGQRAGKTAISSPASQLRGQRARGAEARGLYPRLQRARAVEPASSELDIELKYHEGEPVIREIAPRLEARPAGLFEDQGSAAVYNGLGISILSTPRA